VGLRLSKEVDGVLSFMCDNCDIAGLFCGGAAVDMAVLFSRDEL